MGECGCGAYNADYKFKGPDGITYVVQIYPGCHECCTPAGILLYAFTEEDMKLWDANNLPEIEIFYEGTGIPVIDPGKLKRRMIQAYGADTDEAFVCSDGIDSCFEEAIFDTISEHKNRFIT